MESDRKAWNCGTIGRRAQLGHPDGTGANRRGEASEGRCHDRAATASTSRCRPASRYRCRHLPVDAGIWQ